MVAERRVSEAPVRSTHHLPHCLHGVPPTHLADQPPNDSQTETLAEMPETEVAMLLAIQHTVQKNESMISMYD